MEDYKEETQIMFPYALVALGSSLNGYQDLWVSWTSTPVPPLTLVKLGKKKKGGGEKGLSDLNGKNVRGLHTAMI